MSADPGTVPAPRPAGLRLHRWNDRAVVGVAVAAFAAGFGQFGVVAALGDVARGFGQVNHGATLADQAGLSGTDLGAGLAIMRLASLGASQEAACAKSGPCAVQMTFAISCSSLHELPRSNDLSRRCRSAAVRGGSSSASGVISSTRVSARSVTGSGTRPIRGISASWPM